MNAEIKQKWVEALRSGEYKQGQQVLRTGDSKYCCLGVLCDLMRPQQWASTVHSSPDFHGSFYEFYDGAADRSKAYVTRLPGSLSREAHLSSAICNQLINMNDEGSTFEEIASFIEEKL